MLRYDRQLAPV